jgi:predicted nucleotidyltransferase
MPDLHWNTVNSLLKDMLVATMKAPEFSSFRLVGGTALSLHLGHRVSVDIDLFSDAPYSSIDFDAITEFFKSYYPYVSRNPGQVGMGTSYFVGDSERNAVKVDLYYTDPFIRSELITGRMRIAQLEDIVAMKLDVISRGGRKKDFWDIHILSDLYDLPLQLAFHKERYPYTHDESLIRAKLVDFLMADDDLDPDCLYGKHWELIKLDLVRWVNGFDARRL